MNPYQDLNILIVDDEEINIELASIYLENEGYNIFTALSAQDALVIISQENISLILLDVNMPETNGFELALMLKSEEKTKDIPIIFLTAQHNIEYVAKAFEVGGADYITKPFNVSELKARVNVQLQNILYLHEIKDKQAKLAQLSVTDQLTKLYNALYFESHLKTLQAKKEDFWVLYIRINHFEKINQLYGFSNANKILRNFAAVLEKNSFQNATVSRLFGAHFAVTSKAYTKESMQQYYNKLTAAIEKEKLLKESIVISSILIYVDSHKQVSIADLYKTMQKHLNTIQERGKQLLIVQ